MNLARTIAATLAHSLLATLAIAQQPLVEMEGGSLGGNLGYAIAVLGDIDGDGKSDFAIGSPFDDTVGSDAGAVRVISGADGTVIRTVYGLAPGDRFGHSVVGVGDTSFAAGAPFADPNGTSSGSVRVITAATGFVSQTFEGAANGDRFGWSLASFDDGQIPLPIPPLSNIVIVIGAPYANSAIGASDAGSVTIRYATGQIPNFIQTVIEGNQAGMHLGWSVGTSGYFVPNGMFGGFHHERLMIGSPDYDGTSAASSGRVDVWDMQWGVPIGPQSISFTDNFNGPSAGMHLGYSVAGLEGDTSDFVAGAPFDGTGNTFVYVFDVNGSTISTLHAILLSGGFGLTVARAGQLGGNSDEDFFVGAPLTVSGGVEKGRVWAYDGATGNVLGSMTGTYANGRFGDAIAGRADLDGNSTADFAIGAPDAAIEGTDDGHVEIRRSLSTPSGVLLTLKGAVTGDGCGRSVAGVGDVNADGVPDWIVGAPNDDFSSFPFTSFGANYGSARVISGKTGAAIRSHFGAGYGDELGWSVAALGDVNLDGVPDYAAGAPQRDTLTSEAGYARVYSGSNGALLFDIAGALASSEFGYAVGGGSDVNGDGRDDLIVGAPGTTNGAVYAYSGATGALLGSLQGQASGDRFGSAVAGLGADLTGDGKEEYLVGAPNEDTIAASAGRIYVMRSTTSFLTKWILEGTAIGDLMGSSVARAGDVNHDGVADIVGGAPGHDFLPVGVNAGLARVWSGATGAVLLTTTTSAASTNLGSSVAGVGDVDLDDYDDVAVGAPQSSIASSTKGYVRIVSGKSGAIVFTALGSNLNESLGASVAGVGDLDGDGLPDLVAGAPLDDSHGPNSGLARAISLRALGVKFFGSIPPGCSGPSLLSTFGVPTVGNSSFAYRSNHAPPSSLGLLLIANAKSPFPNGVDLFALGAPFLIDPLLTTLLVGLDMPTSSLGFGSAPGAVPNNPVFQGITLYGQVIWAWPLAACSLPPINLSVSSGLEFTIQ